MKKYLQLEEEMLKGVQKLCKSSLEASKVTEQRSASSSWVSRSFFEDSLLLWLDNRCFLGGNQLQ